MFYWQISQRVEEDGWYWIRSHGQKNIVYLDSKMKLTDCEICGPLKEPPEKNTIQERLCWEKYALELAKTAALRSEDPFIKVGAAVLRFDYSVAGIGYNGAPSKINIDWSNRDERRARVIHAETNALRYCKPGECFLIATTISPCSSCLNLIASYGIKKIIYQDIYKNDQLGLSLAKEYGIEIVQIKD